MAKSTLTTVVVVHGDLSEKKLRKVIKRYSRLYGTKRLLVAEVFDRSAVRCVRGNTLKRIIYHKIAPDAVRSGNPELHMALLNAMHYVPLSTARGS